MLELYQAYGDYFSVMDLTEELISALVEKYCEGKEVQFEGETIDFTQPWRRAQYAELLKEYSGCDIGDIDAIRAKARELELDESDMDDAVVINEVFEGTVEDNLINPTFVMDYPAGLCPLAKCKKDEPGYAERFELFVGKIELANAYTELNDPAKQYENFLVQLRGQEKSLATMDADYITALKYGMPPAGGLGIRDVVLFPLLKSAPE
jgi:lysyl-tRNA synthetase class 2